MAITVRDIQGAIMTPLDNKVTITKPMGTASGDVLVACITGTYYGGPTPAGWTFAATHVNADAGFALYMNVYYKIAGGAEPASYTFQFDANWTGNMGQIVGISGAHPTAPLDVFAISEGGYGLAIDTPFVNPTQSGDLLICYQQIVDFAILSQPAIVSAGRYSDNFQQGNTNFTFPWGTNCGTGMSVGTLAGNATFPFFPPSNAGQVNQAVDYKASVLIAIKAANRPPTVLLEQPVTGETYDLSGTPLFAWAFQDEDFGDSISAFAIKRNTGGADSWYNVGAGTWGGSEVWNTIAVNEFTFPSGKWTNGTAYNYAIAVKDQAGDAGPYSPYAAINGGTPPTVTWLSPSDPHGLSTAPIAHWLCFGQRGFQLRLFSDEQASVPGFNPASALPLWDSGKFTRGTFNSADNMETTVQQMQIPDGYIHDGETYHLYIKVHNTSDVYSNWVGNTFTVTLEAPNQPNVTLTSEEFPSPRVQIDMFGHDNFLSANQSTLDHGWTFGWLPLVNCSVGGDNTWSLDGDWSLKMTPAAAGDMTAINLVTSTTTGKEGFPVTGNAFYTALGTVRCMGGTGRSCRMDIRWYDSAGAVISTTTGSAGTAVTGAGGTALVSFVQAPSNAVWGSIILTVLATANSANIHNWDKIGVFPGLIGTWGRGGYLYGNRLSMSAATASPGSRGMQARHANVYNIFSDNDTPLYDQFYHRVHANGAGDVVFGPSQDSGAGPQDNSAVALDGVLGIPCVPGQEVTMMCSFRDAAVHRSALVFGRFWDAAGNQLFAFLVGNTVTTATGSWTKSVATGTVPAGAKYMQITCSILAAGAPGEEFLVAGLSVHLGHSQLWQWPPGVQTIISGEWSDDEVVWTPVFGTDEIVLDSAQQGTLYDYGAPLNPITARKYRARVKANV